MNYRVMAYIVVLFSSYSLINAPIPENTPYGTDDSFSSVSHHYQRIYYQILIAFSLRNDNKIDSMPQNVTFAYWLNLVLLIFQVVGILSSPLVTFFYLAEQVSIFVFGSTSRASDSRIIISLVIDFIAFLACAYIGEKAK